MEKWADFLICEVKYDTDHSRIVECKVREDLIDKVSGKVAQLRETIAKNLDKYSYYTIYLDSESGNWRKGDKVIKYSLDDEVFIRTDGNKKKQDNLGNLPEY